MNREPNNDPFDLDCESSPKRNYPARSDLLVIRIISVNGSSPITSSQSTSDITESAVAKNGTGHRTK